MLNPFKQLLFPIIKWKGKRIEKKHFSNPPILVGGCPRSGTTMFLSILSAHPEIFCHPKELGLFNDTNSNGDPKRFDRHYTSLIRNQIPITTNRWCEKSPSNIRHFNEINDYFNGRFKFINLIRDGRDVILSKHPTDPSRYWTEPQTWIKDVSLGLELSGNQNVYSIKYEDLILNYEESINNLCKFLEIKPTEEIKDWFSNTKVKKNIAYKDGVRKLSASSIGKWKSPEFSDRVQELLDIPESKPLLSHYGYE